MRRLLVPCSLLHPSADAKYRLQNDKHLASTENMFMPHRVPAKANLMEGKNTLLLHFKSPWYEAKKAERENGGPKPLCELRLK